jgi:AAA family ATP:ADP antiporter
LQMLGVTGLGFFFSNIFPASVAPVAALLGITPLFMSVLLGAAQNILSKSAKYSLFDPCKEMAYIPLDQDSKTKGKAAIDVVGNPLGKSGGALIQQFLIFGVGSLSAATPYLAVILTVLVYMWLKAANSLSFQFDEAMAASNKEP